MGNLILACFVHRGRDELDDVKYTSVLDIPCNKLNEKDEKTLLEHVGKKKAYLFVNLASSWGLTPPNYKQLVQMHKDLKEQGLEIMAFPVNTFG
jgi:glutathione peroxidase-family protein